jgi:hypothetical protein
MTWNVLQDGNGTLQLLDSSIEIPEGWELVAITCNPLYLEYMASITE